VLLAVPPKLISEFATRHPVETVIIAGNMPKIPFTRVTFAFDDMATELCDAGSMVAEPLLVPATCAHDVTWLPESDTEPLFAVLNATIGVAMRPTPNLRTRLEVSEVIPS
jgi:hypothetical protein